MSWSQEKYTEALRFAAGAHRGQSVPATDVPYIVHPCLVTAEVMAALCAESGHDKDLAVQCALLHDVIEDTEVAYDQVKIEFGKAVADGVLALSKDPALPKERQMADSLDRIRQQPQEIWMVKLADRISNLNPPPYHWTKRRIARYGEEAGEIHRTLAEASPLLSARLLAKIEAYKSYAE